MRKLRLKDILHDRCLLDAGFLALSLYSLIYAEGHFTTSIIHESFLKCNFIQTLSTKLLSLKKW